MGQCPTLHAIFLEKADSQAAPPKTGWTKTDREADLVPSPHVFVQEPQALHSDNSQSTGQEMTLQLADSVNAAHATPPKAAATSTERRRSLVPLPQVLEQASHAPQAETTQSIGQATVLQDFCSVRAGQATPPELAGVSTERERVE